MTMHSIVTVTSAASVTALTTVERVKQELSISGTASDTLLGLKIDEASSDIGAHLRRRLPRESIAETFWGWGESREFFALDHYPVASIASVVVDDVEVPPAQYRLDRDAGLLYRLDASGYPCRWWWCKSVIVSYVGGFLLPGQDDRDLPPALEAGAIALVQSFWLSRGRDPLVKEEEVPGVMRVGYWVGAVGEAGELPPQVVSLISPFRRAAV
ncbi:MAG: hypothetical protein GEU95_25320 [Rhizobiales bacterium]|nr:hypothetical protein [Hyphomicrobiales bacterium]